MVPGVRFRGLRSALDGKDLGFAKSMSTLFSFLSCHPSNVEEALSLHVHDEVADVALMSQGLPRVLEYVVWILDIFFKYADDGPQRDEEQVSYLIYSIS